MRFRTAFIAILLGFSLTACSHRRSDADNRQRSNTGDTVARDAGRAAWHAAQGTRKAAEAAGRALGRASHDAAQGWNDASREHRQKPEK